ncbi:MFS transporter, partial [Candidatus Bathyarchaeota archaeon]|nr:MFS transporter [Candidatus Bathyarchaeota archaeon]
MLGASSDEIGLLYAVTALSSVMTLIVAGVIADRYDRKKIILFAWLVWLPVPLIFSLASNWIQMLPGMILYGFWLSGPTGTAYVVTAADKNRLTLTFTILSASWSLGYIFSPALGGYLSANYGMQLVFHLSFILYLLAFLLLFPISSQHASKLDSQPSFMELLKSRRLIGLSLFFAVIMFVLLMIRPLVPQFLAEVYGYGDFEIGSLGSISFLGSVILGILFGKLGDKWRMPFSLAASMAIYSISLAFLVTFGNFTILLVAAFLAGASFINWSLMSAIIGPLAPENARARWISVPQTISMAISFMAPYVGGIFYEFSPQYPFILA